MGLLEFDTRTDRCKEFGTGIGTDIDTGMSTGLDTDTGIGIRTGIGMSMGLDIGTDIGIDTGIGIDKDMDTDTGIDIRIRMDRGMGNYKSHIVYQRAHTVGHLRFQNQSIRNRCYTGDECSSKYYHMP